MEEKSLTEQLDELCDHPLGRKLHYVNYLKRFSRAKHWSKLNDDIKRSIIQRTKTLIDKVIGT